MTEKLYYQNQYQMEFHATPVSKHQTPRGWEIILDRSQFYPEGGGQPSDRGWIAGVPVVDLWKEGDDLVHLLDRDPGEGRLMAKIDWAHRFDYMQQHSAQHLLSAVLFREFGIATLSVHLGEDDLSIEIENSSLENKVLDRVDEIAQEMICRNLPLETTWVDEQEISRLDLRRKSKVSGAIRIVGIGDYDRVPCGGVHCSRSGEIKLIRRIREEKIRGHLRIYWKAGDRALEDYSRKIRQTALLSQLLSAPEELLLDRCRGVLGEVQDLKRQLDESAEAEARREAQHLLEDAVLGEESGIRFIHREYRNREKDFLKRIARQFEGESSFLLLLFNLQGEGAQWLLQSSSDFDYPFPRERKRILELVDGKGGGKPPLWQGMAAKLQGREAMIRECQALLDGQASVG